MVKQVFTNEDGSIGIRALVSRAITWSCDALTTTSHARWEVAWYHKALTQNVSLAKAPTQTVTPHPHPFFAALCGFLQLARVNMRTTLNPFALKSQLYLNARRSAFATLPTLTPAPDSA